MGGIRIQYPPSESSAIRWPAAFLSNARKTEYALKQFMASRVVRGALFAILLALAVLPAHAQDPNYVNRLAPYVNSPARVVDRMLELASIRPGETVYDLGCGDGRIL